MRRKILFPLMLGCVFSAAGTLCVEAGASEPPRGCFRSVAEAITRAGFAAPENAAASSLGFWLESLRHDALLKRNWATVRSCEHPERPAITVDAGPDKEPDTDRGAGSLLKHDHRAPEFSRVEAGRAEARPTEMARTETARAGEAPKLFVPPVVLAGTQIRLVRTEENLRFETAGVAQSSGAIGDRIRVRLLRPTEESGAAEQFAMATVRSAEVLELER